MMAFSSAAAQRELEEKLTQSGTKLSTPPSSTRELLSLIENVESELKSIGQDPSVSMINVLDPIRKALIGTKLLGHSDEIIEVSVVSCICEIMRISAPVLPYDNTEMKVIFYHIIASLEKLPDILSDCYSKAVRVLEAIAKIRLCVMLLDLDYILAVNVFQLFLKIIRPYHPHAVSKYMEDIMTQLIEESDEVSIDFQVSILESLRKKTLDTAPLSSLLGHHVFEKCAARLKPCLLELIKTMNLNFDDYTDVLGSVCREVPEGENTVENAGSVPPVEETSVLQLPQVPQLDGTPTIMNNNNNLEPNGSLKTLKHCNQAEQLKDTDAPSDPLHTNTKDLQQQMNVSGLSEKVRPDTGHDCFDMNESKSCIEEPTNKKEHEKKSGSSSDNAAPKESSSPSETGKQSMPDVLTPNSENTHVNSGSSRKRGRPKKNTHVNSGSSRKRGRPKKNQRELTVRKRSEGTSSPNLTVSIKKEKETVSDAEKKSRSSSDNAASKESSLPSETGKQSMPGVLAPNSENTHVNSGSSRKRGRPKKNTHVNSESSYKRGRPKKNQTELTVRKRSEGKSSPSLTVRIKKEKETVSDAENSSLQQNDLQNISRRKKQSMPDVLAPNSENIHVNSGSARKRGRPKKNQTKLTMRKRSEGTSSPSLTVSIKKEKETVSDAENSSFQQNDLQNISRRTKHSTKQALNEEKDSKKVRFIKDYGEELVGTKVRVWWPLDRKFYKGVISSFDPEIKKHKVKYNDDDEEILNLNRERWELLEEVSVKEEPVTDFPPELCVVSGKKAQGNGSTPGKNIKSEKAPAKDNSTLLSHNSKNIVIKEEAEDESTVPSNALSEEPSTDFLPEVSAIKGTSKKKESGTSSSERCGKKAHRSGRKPR
ncbi:PREDICTED: uncharacterized protein LOC109165335 [Ipomoea nil]|uniref:uncharacterized protein LOC109165335 n=1 Tax=Ipomoea nil TaxID=35883 RepID=UPI000900DFED|nr:PREDICTED: uncharacterized protein LOC109165335 [Ipomoea nil]